MSDLDYDELEEDEELTNEIQLVSFKLEDEEFGIPINEVQEIIRKKPLTHIPGAMAFVEGVIDLRGNILPIIDLRKKLNLQPKEPDDLTRIIIISIDGIETGLIVDSVAEVIRIHKDNVKKAPSLLGKETKYITGIIRIDSRLIVLLEVKNIISEEEIISISNITKQISQTEKTEKNNLLNESNIEDSTETEKKKVSSDTVKLCKWQDTDGKKCTRIAMNGSDYCEIHQPGA